MIRTMELLEIKDFKIRCLFSNGETKLLDLQKALSPGDQYAQKILNPDIFQTAKIGEFGQIYWKNMAEMKDLEGNTVHCDYDLSPEFIYYHSISV